MADFSTPFASTAARRSPNADEKANGFPCGAADQTLFNGMFHRIEAELGSLITYAGLTPSDADFSQLRKAIQALISAATGDGDTEDFLLLSQASARLPIYPEVQSADGRLNFTQPATGTVRMPGGINIVHRGINVIAPAQMDFATLSNRTYHLRWRLSTGFGLFLITDPVYNPDGYPETNPLFDSTYDDVLLARVITNSSNVATITSLANKHDLRASGQEQNARGGFSGSGSSAGYEDGTAPNSINNYNAVALNWARTPITYLTAINDVWPAGGASQTQGSGEWSAGVRPLSRYQIAVWGQGDIDIWTGWAART